ncbi:hypothetical protein G6F37_006336 [Rhizopus arrhizus]|nr:hypothetical protein G6F38_004352 [Rhizopus arrhizus]KAG1157852.1 hypothetical protein G6F37_006336 [Rhizopus arrhizus]
MKSIVAAIAALAITMVSAQSTNIVTPHAPTLNQVLTAGETTTITWTPIAGFDTISTIDLLQGASSALTPVTGGHVASNVASSLGSYSWTVPSTLPAGSDYALSFGSSPNVSYTPYFTIQAASGTSGSSSSAVSSSAAPSSSAAASSSAASSPAASSSVAASSSAASKPASSSPAAAVSSNGSKPASSSPAAASSSAASVSTSAGNKNVAAVGIMAAAGAVVAALI